MRKYDYSGWQPDLAAINSPHCPDDIVLFLRISAILLMYYLHWYKYIVFITYFVGLVFTSLSILLKYSSHPKGFSVSIPQINLILEGTNAQ